MDIELPCQIHIKNPKLKYIIITIKFIFSLFLLMVK